MTDVNFETLKDNFDSVFQKVNVEKESVTLQLKNNRKVYIMSEDDYNAIQKFHITFSPQPFQK